MGTIAQKLQKLEETKEAIRQAIIGKGQTVANTDPFSSYPAKISAIQTGVDTSDANATAATIRSGYTAYVKGTKITGTMPSQAAQTITPGTTDKTISSGRYLTGTQTIKGDVNLKADNIKSGVSVFGVTGNYTVPYISSELTLDSEADSVTIALPSTFKSIRTLVIDGSSAADDDSSIYALISASEQKLGWTQTSVEATTYFFSVVKTSSGLTGITGYYLPIAYTWIGSNLKLRLAHTAKFKGQYLFLIGSQ